MTRLCSDPESSQKGYVVGEFGMTRLFFAEQNTEHAGLEGIDTRALKAIGKSKTDHFNKFIFPTSTLLCSSIP